MSTRRERAKAPTAQLNKQLAEASEAERLMRERRQEDLRDADIYTDLAKLVFGGVIIGGIFEEMKHPVYLYAIGVVVFLLLIRIGNIYFKRGIIKK